MNDVDNKIIELLDAVYNLSDDNRNKLVWSIQGLSEEDKENILVSVFKRYEAFEDNAKNLAKGVQHISNELDEEIEHQEAENVLLSL